VQYCKKGVHLFGEYYALWDGYYTLYKQKVYPVVRVDGWWYIFQKLRNPHTRQWEGGIATRLTPTVFRLNPDLDPFEGDLLRQLVIRPIEDELDLLTEQVHEAPDDEPEVPQPESPQESDASVPDQPKRMSAVTLTPTQSTIATALTSRSGPLPLVRPQGRPEEEEEAAAEEEEAAEVEEEDQSNRRQPNRQSPLKGMGSWKGRNPLFSTAIERKPTSSCMNSNFTNSSTPPHQS
jgi:hypothetical protein